MEVVGGAASSNLVLGYHAISETWPASLSVTPVHFRQQLEALVDRGLATARMLAHITYLSEESMRRKFGRRIQDAEAPRFGFDVDFEVESYLQHQGASFLKRFDAGSYLYLTRVMDYYDAFADPAATARAIASGDTRFLVVSFDSDWRFDTTHSKEIVRVLSAAGAHVTFREIPSPHGHDSFLLEIPEYHRTVAGFLDRLHRELVE